MLDRGPPQRCDELAENDLARHRLRGLDHRPDIQLLYGCADRRGRRRRSQFFAQPRVALVELPHLAERPPPVVAVPRIAEIGKPERLESSRQLTACRTLITD